MIDFRCTFTGVDEKTNLDDLKELSKKYPFIEWGVLFSVSENKSFGRNRYPSMDWFLQKMCKLGEIRKETGVSLALHVCGKAVGDLLNGTGLVSEMVNGFNRVQINLRYKPDVVAKLERLMDKHKDIIFITQHNNVNVDLWKLINKENHQVLFDKSGGRGIEANDWEKPLENKVCGYAGGLGLDNIEYQLDNIIKVVNGNQFWIDMEGKIRLNDEFDLSACEIVAQKVSKRIEDEYGKIMSFKINNLNNLK